MNDKKVELVAQNMAKNFNDGVYLKTLGDHVIKVEGEDFIDEAEDLLKQLEAMYEE